MRRYLALTILIGFLALSTFSLLGMSHSDDHERVACIAVRAGVFDCSAGQNPMDFAASHLDALREFSEATFGVSWLNALLYSFALLFLLGLSLAPSRLEPFGILSFGFGSTSFFSPFKEDIARWLSIHENSPSVS